MKETAIRMVMGVALVALLAKPAAAQKGELGVGIASQNQSWNGCCGSGLTIDFARTFSSTETRSIAVLVDFSWLKFTIDAFEEHDYPIVGGVRFKFFRNRRVSLFVQGTAGVMPWTDNDPDDGTDVVAGGGGGIQTRLTDRFDAKVQVDLFADNDRGDWYRYGRLLFAGVYKLGAK